MSNRIDNNTMAVFLAFLAQTINSATTTSGEIIDTQNAVDANMAVTIDAFTSGDLKVQIFESDDNGMAGATLIPASLVKGDGYDSVILAAALASKQTRNYHVHRTMFKRFIQTRLVSSNTPVYNVHGTAVLGSLTRSKLDSENLTLPV